MREKRPERYAARHVELRQDKDVVGAAEIISRSTGHKCAGVREKRIDRLHASEPRQGGRHPCRAQEEPIQRCPQELPNHGIIVAECRSVEPQFLERGLVALTSGALPSRLKRAFFSSLERRIGMLTLMSK